MLPTKCKISKFRQVSINRTCNHTFSVAIKKPKYRYNYDAFVSSTSHPKLVSLFQVEKL